jgi:hypothetical protein
MNDVYRGTCFCGKVEFEATGAPAVMGYCHCDDCKSWSAAPINAFSLWPPDSIRITKGEAHVGSFHQSEQAYRKFCKTCGGHLMTDHPAMKLVDVYANILHGFTHTPTMHVHYQSRMVDVKDGVPKFRDLPSDFGGSGEIVTE